MQSTGRGELGPKAEAQIRFGLLGKTIKWGALSCPLCAPGRGIGAPPHALVRFAEPPAGAGGHFLLARPGLADEWALGAICCQAGSWS